MFFGFPRHPVPPPEEVRRIWGVFRGFLVPSQKVELDGFDRFWVVLQGFGILDGAVATCI